jgi:hypothetical protein
MTTQRLELIFDKTSMPADRLEVRRETIRTMADEASISYERPPEHLSDLVELRNPPLQNVVDVAGHGGKELSPEAKAFVDKDYRFYQANLGINLGPSTEINFVQVQLAFQLIADDISHMTIFDIFPQTIYEEKLKISGSVGLDLGMSYKVPTALPLEAEAKAKFAIEPKPWVWKVATVESAGQGTLKARWLFKVDENVANLQTSLVVMTKSKPPISVNIKGWVEIDPGFLRQNYYYNIEPVTVSLQE